MPSNVSTLRACTLRLPESQAARAIWGRLESGKGSARASGVFPSRNAVDPAAPSSSAPVEGVGVEAAADWDHLRTPETYLGYGRGSGLVSGDGHAFDGSHLYEIPEHLGFRQWALAGKWTVGGERVVLDEAGGTIACRFHARDANVVLSRGAHEEIPFRVRLDGKPPDTSHGVDSDEAGNGVPRAGRMYQLVRQTDRVRERTLEITFLKPGAEAYSFTFG